MSVGRNLDCSGAILANPDGYSLSAAGADIKGTAYFSETQEWITYPEKRPFASHGTLRLEGATIDGDLVCSAGRFLAGPFLPSKGDPSKFADKNLDAIAASCLKVGSDIFLDNNFEANGNINLISARVGGDLMCDTASLSFPGEEPLVADGIIVEGTTFLRQVKTNGILRFVQADLKQGLYLNDATFDPTKICQSWTKDQSNAASIELGGPSCGIFARHATIGGTFRWKGVTKVKDERLGQLAVNKFWLFISDSRADRVEDDRSSWLALDRFEITDCQYTSIANLTDGDLRWRLDELDRQYAASKSDAPAAKQFRPQPYIQLAATFRAAGYETAAQDVLVRLEKNRTLYGNVGRLHKLWRKYVLDGFLRYGYAPLRPIIIILIWALVSAVLFQIGYDSNQIVAASDNQESAQASFLPKHARIPFNAIVFAVDTLVPIVDLNQKKNWTVATLSSFSDDPDKRLSYWEEFGKVLETFPNNCFALLLIFNTFFGWFMTTLFAAGVSGLLRTAKEG